MTTNLDNSSINGTSVKTFFYYSAEATLLSATRILYLFTKLCQYQRQTAASISMRFQSVHNNEWIFAGPNVTCRIIWFSLSYQFDVQLLLLTVVRSSYKVHINTYFYKTNETSDSGRNLYAFVLVVLRDRKRVVVEGACLPS